MLLFYEQRQPLAAPDGTKLFIVSVVQQKNYFAIYWRDFVFKSFNLPKYTSLPHLWHSVITFTAFSRPNNLTSRQATKKARCKAANDVTRKNIPKNHRLGQGGVRTFFPSAPMKITTMDCLGIRATNLFTFIYQESNKQERIDSWKAKEDGKRKKMKIKPHLSNLWAALWPWLRGK